MSNQVELILVCVHSQLSSVDREVDRGFTDSKMETMSVSYFWSSGKQLIMEMYPIEHLNMFKGEYSRNE